MAPIFGDVGFHRWQFRDLMAPWLADVVAPVQHALTVATCWWHEINRHLHTLGWHQRSTMPRMPRLAAGLAPTFPAAPTDPLPASETIRRGWLRRRRRVLLAQRQLPFQVGDPFLLLGDFFRLIGVFLTEALVFLSQSLKLTGLATGGGARDSFFCGPASTRHGRYGTPIVSACTAP